MTPAKVMAASPPAMAMPTASAEMAIKRRSMRSARAPPIGPARASWTMPAKVTAPTQAPCPVSSKTSQPRASSMVQNDAEAKNAFQKTRLKSGYSRAGCRSVMRVSSAGVRFKEASRREHYADGSGNGAQTALHSHGRRKEPHPAASPLGRQGWVAGAS